MVDSRALNPVAQVRPLLLELGSQSMARLPGCDPGNEGSSPSSLTNSNGNVAQRLDRWRVVSMVKQPAVNREMQVRPLPCQL